MHKLLLKNTSVQVEVLKRSDGTFTDLHADTIKVLLDEHFPGNVIGGEINGVEWKDNHSRDDWKVASEITSEDKIKWAIKSFMPFKSSGTNGIFPALLQHGIKTIIPPLNRIYKACLAFGYIPKKWREVKV